MEHTIKTKTAHFLKKFDINKEIFDSYMQNEAMKLKELELELDEKSKVLITALANEKLLKEPEKELALKVNEAFSLGFHILDSINRPLVKIYFQDMIPSDCKTNLRGTRKAINNALIIMENPEYNKLNMLEDQYKSAIVEIDQFLEKKNDTIVIKDEAKKEFDIVEEKWEHQYARLKSYYNGYLRDKDLNYKIFFEELKNKSSKHSKNDDIEEVNVVEENVHVETNDTPEER
jgi:hypothetical protein